MPFNLGFAEMLVVLVVAVLVFGGNLPQVARRFGRTVSEFKRGMRDEFRRLEDAAPAPRDVDPAAWEEPKTAPPEEPPANPT
jgi:sec-independent protein translocase protein TatA